jgi:hypothetical protein
MPDLHDQMPAKTAAPLLAFSILPWRVSQKSFTSLARLHCHTRQPSPVADGVALLMGARAALRLKEVWCHFSWLKNSIFDLVEGQLLVQYSLCIMLLINQPWEYDLKSSAHWETSAWPAFRKEGNIFKVNAPKRRGP